MNASNNSSAPPEAAAHWQLASTWWVLGCGICWLKMSLLLSRLPAGHPLKIPLLVGVFGVAHGLVWARAVAPGWRLVRRAPPGQRAVVGWLTLLVLGQLGWLAVALWLASPARRQWLGQAGITATATASPSYSTFLSFQNKQSMSKPPAPPPTPGQWLLRSFS